MRPETDVVFLSVPLSASREFEDRQEKERPLFLDPVLWSDDGKSVPDLGVVWSVVDGTWLLTDARNDRDERTWYYHCTGPNAANARKTRIEPKNDRIGTDWIVPGTAFEFGIIGYGRRRHHSSRTRYVVLEVASDRLIVAQMKTLAQAMKLGNEVQARLANDPNRFRRRRETWKDATRERSTAEVLDDEAIEEVFG